MALRFYIKIIRMKILRGRKKIQKNKEFNGRIENLKLLFSINLHVRNRLTYWLFQHELRSLICIWIYVLSKGYVTNFDTLGFHGFDTSWDITRNNLIQLALFDYICIWAFISYKCFYETYCCLYFSSRFFETIKLLAIFSNFYIYSGCLKVVKSFFPIHCNPFFLLLFFSWKFVKHKKVFRKYYLIDRPKIFFKLWKLILWYTRTTATLLYRHGIVRTPVQFLSE